MSSYRLSVNLEDRSRTVSTDRNTLCYTAIEAKKGPNVPIKIERGQEQRILETYGYPDVNYPGVQDVIDLNRKSPLYVVAPTSGTNELYGGVLVTETGSESFNTGVETNDDVTLLEALPEEETAGTGDGVQTSFTYTLSEFETYNDTSLVIKVDGTELTTYSVSDAEPEVITADELTSGSYTRATGEVSLDFTSAPADGAVITVEYTRDVSSGTYFAILDKYPQKSDRAIQVTSSSNGAFSVAVFQKDTSGNYYEIASSPIEMSIVEGAKNGVGQNIYAPSVFEDNDYFTVLLNTDTFTSFTDDEAIVSLVGGSRGDTIDGTALSAAYTPARDTKKYPVNLFFDTTAEPLVATVFETMRGSYNKYARYLLPGINQSAQDHIDDPSITKNSIDNRGIIYYVLNWGVHKDLYNDSPFLCSNMGLITGKFVDILEFNGGYGGYSPSWVDENGMGGQLGSSIISLSHSATEDQLQSLDRARLNPVVDDFEYGIMIVSDRTTYSIESDYSYIGPSGLIDSIIYLVATRVLPLQYNKLNDDFHREVVRSSADTIVGNVENLLEAYAVKCDRENNTAEILNQKKFVLTIGVQITPNSQFIVFNMINSRLGVDIEEVVA